MTPDDLKALAVTEGDGLYADEYEAGKYTYKGANPNNYITFNNETWRIISINSDGTIKIMRNETIGSRAFASSNSNDWETSDIKSYLNDTYLPTITTNQDKIVSHTWYTGYITFKNNDIVSQINFEKDNEYIWNGKVGMISMSEYLLSNSDKEQCETFELFLKNYEVCKNTNYIFNLIPSKTNMWLITKINPVSNFDNIMNIESYIDGIDGQYGGATNYNPNAIPPQQFRFFDAEATNKYNVFPSLYLSSDITLSGTGSSSDPFIITN